MSKLEIQKQVTFDLDGLNANEVEELERELYQGESLEYIFDKYGLNEVNEQFDFVTSFNVTELN